MELFYRENRFDEKCLFDWGGGEPKVNPFFEECVIWLSEHGFSQRINTNAIRFSEETYKALSEGRASLRISIDAGPKEVFFKVKGHNHYDDVWNNIKIYCSASNEIYIKYNIFNFNSDKSEADIFLDKCEMAGVKHVYVEAEHFSYGQINNVGPLYFNDKELEFAHYLYNESKKGAL